MQSGVALCVYLLLLGDQRMLFCFVLFCFFIEIICWATWISQVQITAQLPPIFLRAHPWK